MHLTSISFLYCVTFSYPFLMAIAWIVLVVVMNVTIPQTSSVSTFFKYLVFSFVISNFNTSDTKLVLPQMTYAQMVWLVLPTSSWTPVIRPCHNQDLNTCSTRSNNINCLNNTSDTKLVLPHMTYAQMVWLVRLLLVGLQLDAQFIICAI
jgi:hypothetical protein